MFLMKLFNGWISTLPYDMQLCAFYYSVFLVAGLKNFAAFQSMLPREDWGFKKEKGLLLPSHLDTSDNFTLR